MCQFPFCVLGGDGLYCGFSSHDIQAQPTNLDLKSRCTTAGLPYPDGAVRDYSVAKLLK